MNEKDSSDDTSVRNGEDGTVRAEWDESVLPSTVIVEAVAAASDRDSLDIDPLYEYVDLEAVDDLITSGVDDDSNGIQVTFEYKEFTVSIGSGGAVEVMPGHAQR